MQQFAIGTVAVLGIVLFAAFGMRGLALLLSLGAWAVVALIILVSLLDTLTVQ